MRGLFHVGTVARTPLRIHWSTWLLPLAVLGWGVYSGISPRGLAWLGLFVVATLFCVLLHELGHAAAARWAGVRVHDILLLPIGGAARLGSLPSRPWHEAGVALAGPLVNLLIALALAPALWFWPRYEWIPIPNNYDLGSMLVSLALFNGVVCAFNLLPAFPLDGGRLLRATLCNWMPRLRATRVAAFVARIVALAGLAYGTYDGSFLLMGFAAYVFVAAGREVRGAKVRAFLEDTCVGEVALPVRVFEPATTVGDVRHYLRHHDQRGAVIADDCSPIGFVTPAMLTAAEDDERHVGDLEMCAVVCHDSQAPLRELSIQFAEHPRSVALEEIDRRPAGFVDLDILDECFRSYAEAA